MASPPTDNADMPLLIASYDRYVDAESAVDTLSDHGFPVERVSIVGSDLRLVEKVTGRLTVARGRGDGRGAPAGEPPMMPEFRRPAPCVGARGGAADTGRVRGVPAARHAGGAPAAVPEYSIVTWLRRWVWRGMRTTEDRAVTVGHSVDPGRWRVILDEAVTRVACWQSAFPTS
jgi:Heat induced stress protein YflT domain